MRSLFASMVVLSALVAGCSKPASEPAKTESSATTTEAPATTTPPAGEEAPKTP
jgi:hypothetical protein